MIFLFIGRHIHADATEGFPIMHHVASIQIAVGNPQSRIGLSGPRKGGCGVDVFDAGALEHPVTDTRPNG